MKFGLSFGKRRRVFFLALCFSGVLWIAPTGLAAQGAAAEIEALLATDAVTYAQASRFVLEAADAAAIPDPAQAFDFAMERGWLPGRAAPDDPARLDGVALLLMRSFDLRGGVWFTLTGSAHFAYREMEHMGFIRGRASPRQNVSGDTLLYLTGRALEIVELRDAAEG